MKRRGFTLIELSVALWIFLFATFALLTLMAWGGMVFHRSTAREQSKSILHLAVQRMSPDLRNAYRIDPSEDRRRITVVLPLEDEDGGYAMPFQDGTRITYYLSDNSGSHSKTGNILWRAVNGEPDPAWSLREGKARLNLGSQSLMFTPNISGKPQSIQFSMGSTQWDGKSRVMQTVSANVVLRNSQFHGESNP
jgi:prepilin-type N-terminal cleavage/methylation domain-containing protein